MYTATHPVQLMSIAGPSGVHADHIVQTLRLQQHLSYIPRDVMKSTVRSLEDSSDIYETASNCYKIVG